MNIRDWGILIGATIIFGLSLIAIIILRSFYDFSILSPEEQEKRRAYRNIELPIFYKVMPILVFNIIVTALLIAGIVKNQHKLMKPWLYSTVASVLFECLIIVLGFCFGLLLLLVGILVIQLFLFLFMYIIYDDIRNANLQAERVGLHIDQKNSHSCGNPNYV